jgi:hypothetical protein
LLSLFFIRRLVISQFALAVAVSLMGAASALAQSSTNVRLVDGTRVQVRLAQVISSETSKPGDLVRLEVVHDVTVNDDVIVTRGTPVRGTVVEAVPSRWRRQPARLVFRIDETTSVAGQSLRLRWSSTAGAAGVGIVVARATRSALLLWAVEGTRFEAFVDGDQTVAGQVPTTSRRPRVHASPPIRFSLSELTQPAAVLTNEDVVRLVTAGVDEEVVLGTIARSRPAFRLDADDVLRLKQAGVSNRILEAMIKAR